MTGISSMDGSSVRVRSFLNEQLVVPQRGLGDGKVTLAGCNRRLVLHDLHRRNVLQLQLFLVVGQGLIGVFQ